ncbi:MAG TPA: protease complex subunit PrcB family protein [Vicinamibacterales bacterium]|nr:protease complex subunit PrcB family protein [Vicinamibacterales bacterium]
MTSAGITTVAKGHSSEIVDAARQVIRDPAAWQALWSAHAGSGSEPPHVDFATEMVAAAFAGERPTPGHEIEIVEVRHGSASLAVLVREVQPTRGTTAAQMIVTPFHIVTLPRYEGDVRFTDTSGTPFRQTDNEDDTVRQQPTHDVDRLFVRAAADAAAPSSTGLDPNFAAALTYLAGPFSGILILLVERSNGFVRFHAWQSVLGLGGLGLLSAGTLIFSFLTLLLSPMVFTVMYRLSEVLAIVWVVAWVVCLIKAFGGSRWHMPVAGRYAERLTADRHG